MDELYALSTEQLEARLLAAAGAATWPPVGEALALARQHCPGGRPGAAGAAGSLWAHALRSALLLREVGGIKDAALLCAALLRDACDDGALTRGRIEEHFGGKVSDLVRAAKVPPQGPGQNAYEHVVGYFKNLAWEGRDPQILMSAAYLDLVKTARHGVPAERRAEYLHSVRRELLPLTLACNTPLYHALDAALTAAGCPPP